MRDVTDETFEQEVLRAERPVLVDFWAPWCGPCKAIEPALEELDAASESVAFVKIDIDENPKVADRYGVLSLPTVMLFEGGQVRRTVHGARPKKHFARTFAEYL
jgi:thioredoxin 1